MDLKLRFQPISHSWVALHPQPKGVVQFIAGAFFGTFGPMFFYRHLLESLYEKGYTIVLLPFNFSFDHYQESAFLIREQYEILPELVRMAKLAEYDYSVYLDNKNFAWIGHSLGCKYISLLEGFSALPETPEEREAMLRGVMARTRSEAKIQQVIADVEILIQDLDRKIQDVRKLIQLYVHEQVQIPDRFIKGQVSVLLAPAISDTSSAVRPKALADLVDRLGLGVQPTPEETHNLIKDSYLFNRLALVQFESDRIATETCDWFTNILRKPPETFRKILYGGHLRPLGIRQGNTVVNIEEPFIESTQKRYDHLDCQVIELLENLRIFQAERDALNTVYE